MTRYIQCVLLVLYAGALIVGCASTCPPSEPITIMDQTPGQTERFTQFELDVAFRKQAREDMRALRLRSDLEFCCVVFHNDVKMLNRVITHFRENVSVAETDEYGIHVLESENEYVVYFLERYREATQYQVEGFWYPGISEVDGLRQYGYIVDRDTLEILEFEVIPR